jgi:hypothetical protein
MQSSKSKISVPRPSGEEQYPAHYLIKLIEKGYGVKKVFSLSKSCILKSLMEFILICDKPVLHGCMENTAFFTGK